MSEEADRTIGRYVLFDEIAAGGMATVHLGKLKGPVGFSRTVAIKRLHPEYARDPQFLSMFLDEARLASRVRHPNVVPTLDVVTTEGQLFLVMEYVQGVSLASLLDTTSTNGERVPARIVASIVSGALMGLHAAHEAQDEDGHNLGIVHRDVSPSNVLVGSDGMPRVLDFGVAKAAGRMHNTRGNVLKGTLGYIAPEQFNKENIDRRADVYSAAVMLWEALCGKPLFEGETEYAVIAKALFGEIPLPSSVDPELAPFDDVVMKGLDREPDNRFDTAREMALAIEQCAGTASNAAVAEWLKKMAGDTLQQRAHVLAKVEGGKGRRLSEIRAAMLDALDLEEELTSGALDDEAPSTDRTAARDTGSPDTTAQTATIARPVKKSSGTRVAVGVLAIAAVAGLAVAWMQSQKSGAVSRGGDGSQAPAASVEAAPETEPADSAPTNTAPADTVPATAPEPEQPDPAPTPEASASADAAPSASASPPAPRWPGPRSWPKPKPTQPKPAPTGKKPWERDRFGE
jgi:serine/threonine-protein kinase